MDELMKLKENLCSELEKYSGMTSFSTQDISVIHQLASAVKNIGKVCNESEGSYRGMSYRGNSYDGGSSNRGGYSRDNGGSYHDDREWMIRELDRARSFASGDREKDIIRKVMEELRR